MKINLRPAVKAAAMIKKTLTNLHESPYYKVLRVRQWLKNGSLFLAIVFGGRLLDFLALKNVITATTIFCALSSGVYILNDIVDAASDRTHPVKKGRPIASGRMPIGHAQAMFLALTSGSLICAFLLGEAFFVAAASYVILMISYSLFLKKIPVIDVLTLSCGFVLRVFAGSFASGTAISALLILTTIFTALFISFAKRRSEAVLLESSAIYSRQVFKNYPIFLIDKYLTLTFGAAFMTYSFFTYQFGSRTTSKLLASLLPATLAKPNWLMLTIPVVFYALSRYMYLIYEGKQGEYPENTLLSDKILLGTSITWAAMIILTIYGLPLL